MNGYICSGWKRPPHFATDLTADHPLPTLKVATNTKNSWSIVVLAIVQTKHNRNVLEEIKVLYS